MQIEKIMMDRDLHEYPFNHDHIDYVDHIDKESMIKKYRVSFLTGFVPKISLVNYLSVSR